MCQPSVIRFVKTHILRREADVPLRRDLFGGMEWPSTRTSPQS